MLNLITITSIKTTCIEVENDSQNDVQRLPFINSNSSYTIKNQKRGNTQSLSKTFEFNEKTTYFSIQSYDKVYKHPFQGVGNWLDFDPARHSLNKPNYEYREYLYNPLKNKIYNKFIFSTPIQGYQSPIINRVLDNEVKLQVFVNIPQHHKFKLKYVTRDQSIIFFSLIEYDREVYVSSVILFFKYNKKICCSIQQIESVLMLKKTKYLMKRNWYSFIKKYALNNLSETPEHSIRQVEIILENVNYVNKLLNLWDGADFKKNEDKGIIEERNEDPTPIVQVNQCYIYDDKHWKLWKPEDCEITDPRGYIYSLKDEMMTKYEYYSSGAVSELSLKWRITEQDVITTFMILHTESARYFLDKIICKQIFIFLPICSNQKTTFDKIEYKFFYCNKNIKTLFCVKLVEEKLQTVNVCDIDRILFILKTSNLFYSLTLDRAYAEPSLLNIIEESVDSSDDDTEYKGEEEIVSNSTEEESKNEVKNTFLKRIGKNFFSLMNEMINFSRNMWNRIRVS